MRKQLSINISVGRSCFVQCFGCYNFFGQKLMDSYVIKNFLAYARTRGIEKATLCGGDPLSRPDILPLLKQIKNMGFFVILDTVGTPLLGDTKTIFYGRADVSAIKAKDLVKSVDLIGIPLDGPTDEIIAIFRKKRQNLLNEQLQILNILDAEGIDICINSVVHKGNIDELCHCMPLVKHLVHLRKWQFFQYMPIGPLGYKNQKIYNISDNQFMAFENMMKFEGDRLIPNCDLEFKLKSKRKGNYLLVDAEGIAWIPKGSFDEEWSEHDSNDERMIVGNIHNEDEYPMIFEKVFHSQQGIML